MFIFYSPETPYVQTESGILLKTSYNTGRCMYTCILNHSLKISHNNGANGMLCTAGKPQISLLQGQPVHTMNIISSYFHSEAQDLSNSAAGSSS